MRCHLEVSGLELAAIPSEIMYVHIYGPAIHEGDSWVGLWEDRQNGGRDPSLEQWKQNVRDEYWKALQHSETLKICVEQHR